MPKETITAYDQHISDDRASRKPAVLIDVWFSALRPRLYLEAAYHRYTEQELSALFELMTNKDGLSNCCPSDKANYRVRPLEAASG